MGCLSLLQEIFPIQGLNQVSCFAGRFFTFWATRKSAYRFRRLEKLGFDPWFRNPGFPGVGNGSPVQYSCLDNPRTEEHGGLPSMGLQRIKGSWVTAHIAPFLAHGRSSAKVDFPSLCFLAEYSFETNSVAFMFPARLSVCSPTDKMNPNKHSGMHFKLDIVLFPPQEIWFFFVKLLKDDTSPSLNP